MKQKIFAVMGATGHIGRVIVEDLLKRGHIVRAIGRNSSKLHQLELKGAQSISCDFDDAEALAKAFSGAYAIFTLLPSTKGEAGFAALQDKVSEAICTAINNSGTKRVVNLSSVGAHLAEGTGLIKGLYRNEKRLDSIGSLDVLIHLRPDFFMENFEQFIPMIKNQGVIKSPLNQNLPIPMVCTRDIGWKAADFLDSTAPFGHISFEFVGPKQITMNQATEILARALDQPHLWYDEITSAEAKKELLAAGIQPDVVDLMLEMYEGFNSGHIIPTQQLKQTHRGTTSFDEYAQWLAHKHLAIY